MSNIHAFVLIMFLSLFCICCAQENLKDAPEEKRLIVNTDVINFYAAFDSIQLVDSQKEKKKILKHLFLEKASPGQKAMIKARRYKDQEYLDAIQKYPKFFESLRKNMMSTNSLTGKLNDRIEKFKTLYPEIKPARIYFTVGAFRSNGTTLADKVLIGCELALVDDQTDLSEFPEDYWARNYWKSIPYQNIIKLNMHEYVHTQQIENTSANLLTYSFREGVAEFISDLIFDIDKNSSNEPSIVYGRENEKAVMSEFTKDMFDMDFGYWLWSNADNPFGTRDLRYFAGYSIAEKYYQSSENKENAIKDMVDLNYKDALAVETLVDKIGYFDKPLSEYKK